MADNHKNAFPDRGIGRRNEDFNVRKQIHKHHQLFEVGQTITSTMDFDKLFEVVMDQTNQIMDCRRSSVFLYDEKRKDLYSLVATGVQKNEIRIPADQGIAGWVFQNRQAVIIADVYSDPRFYSDIDLSTGFKTGNIVCVPLITKQDQCIGALQGLNKISGNFTEDDRNLLIAVSHYVSIACENARLYEDLKALDKARERVINHLAHELKTPLAIISIVIDRIARDLGASAPDRVKRAFDRGKRNLERLIALQEKIDDILNQKSRPEKDTISRFIKEAADFMEETAEGDHRVKGAFLNKVTRRIESLYAIPEFRPEAIPLSRALHDMCDLAAAAMGPRHLHLIRRIAPRLILVTDRTVLEKVCGSLLKNAIENTPDEGTIEVTAGASDSEIFIEFHDFGVGITEQNSKLIFGGFFHTQETDFYTSKRPYEFNAGGSGADLLRVKVFSERYGFTVFFDSTRCRFIPTDKDICAGRVSACQYVREGSECTLSGGSIFSVKFPVRSFKTIIGQSSPAAG